MNLILGNICGILAVGLFVFSYQMKTRNALILVNGASRILYVLQYILLGAFEGAALDVIALFVTIMAQKKDQGLFRKFPKATMIGSAVLVITSGLLMYQNMFSLLPIAGVLFETGALWLHKEKHIRILSFFGAPCWLIYNLVFSAYGSALGNVLTVVSIGLAIYRYDIRKKEP